MAHVIAEVFLSGGVVDHLAIMKESILSKSHAASDRALLDQLEISEEDGTVFVLCPNVFAQKYLTRVYKDIIISAVRT